MHVLKGGLYNIEPPVYSMDNVQIHLNRAQEISVCTISMKDNYDHDHWKSVSISSASCEIPKVQANVIVELNNNLTNGQVTISYYCYGSNGSTIAASVGITSVCSEGGRWIPNPADYTCEDLPNSNGKPY